MSEPPSHISSPHPWPAPAKLNLMLRIVGRRADGYHELQTVFQFLDWGDRLWLRPRDDGVIRLLDPLPGVPPERDLVWRAARLLQAETGTAAGAEIRVHKVVPMGAGLGGGSSDAATTLVALNRLWGTGLERSRLAELGLRLGADVPVFVTGRSAWAEGVGERLRFLTLPEPWFLLLVPDVEVSTGEVFGDPELTRSSIPIKMRDFLNGVGGNDCERVVRRRFPLVAQAMDWLSRFGSAHLTGTGACVYAEMPSEARAREVAESVPKPWRVYVARGRNRSRLLDRV
jgi:4-diphosphocytidyl-2-C-methyl-D-erythritol kinase